MKIRNNNIVGRNIRKQRMLLNLTQEEVALRAGLSQGYVNQLESGKKGFSQNTLQTIADVIGMTLSAFFEDVEVGNSQVRDVETVCEKRKFDKRDVWEIFSNLPTGIANHYILLMKMEVEIIRRERESG